VATAPLTRVISGLTGVHDLDDPALAGLTRAARYDTLLGLAAANLRVGRPVILVAPFSTERARPSAWAHTTQRLATEPTLIWLHLPPDELIRRLTRRAEARDQTKIRDPAAFLAALDLAPPSRPAPTPRRHPARNHPAASRPPPPLPRAQLVPPPDPGRPRLAPRPRSRHCGYLRPP